MATDDAQVAIQAVLAKYAEQKNQARQHENLRASVANFTLAIAGGVLAFAGNKDSVAEFRIISALFVFMLGLFGALLSWKHYERFRWHQTFAVALDRMIEDLTPAAKIVDYKCRQAEHERKWRIIASGRAYLLWILPSLLTALLGAALFAMLLRPRYPTAASIAFTVMTLLLVGVFGAAWVTGMKKDQDKRIKPPAEGGNVDRGTSTGGCEGPPKLE